MCRIPLLILPQKSWSPVEVQHLRAAVCDSFAVLAANGDPLAQLADLQTRELLARRVFACAGRGETNERRLIVYSLAGLHS